MYSGLSSLLRLSQEVDWSNLSRLDSPLYIVAVSLYW